MVHDPGSSQIPLLRHLQRVPSIHLIHGRKRAFREPHCSCSRQHLELQGRRQKKEALLMPHPLSSGRKVLPRNHPAGCPTSHWPALSHPSLQRSLGKRLWHPYSRVHPVGPQRDVGRVSWNVSPSLALVDLDLHAPHLECPLNHVIGVCK